MPGLLRLLFRVFGSLWLANLAVLAMATWLVICQVVRLRQIRTRPSTLKQIEGTLENGDLPGALEICVRALPSVSARAAFILVDSALSGAEDAEASCLRVMALVDRELQGEPRVLPGLGILAIFMGILGTAAGLVQAFAAFGLAAPEPHSVLLTRGTSHTFHPMVLGGCIGLFTTLSHLFTSRWKKRLREEALQSAAQVQRLVERHRR